jgi:excisionase family DNA binding protein
VTVALLLLSGLYCILGLIIIYYDRYPFRGNRIVTGRYARIIGISIAIPGVIGLVGSPFVSQSSLLFSIVTFLFVIAMINANAIHRSYSIEIDKTKRKRLPLPDVLTVSEAARYLKVEEVYVLHLIEDGELKAKAIGGDYRIPRAALQVYLDA